MNFTKQVQSQYLKFTFYQFAQCSIIELPYTIPCSKISALLIIVFFLTKCTYMREMRDGGREGVSQRGVRERERRENMVIL